MSALAIPILSLDGGPIKGGVPQGSVVPLLFLIYVNDTYKAIP